MAAKLGSVLLGLLTLNSSEHTSHSTLLSQYENGKFYHGVQLGTEHHLKFDDNELFLHPEWNQFHQGSYTGTGIFGWRFTGLDPKIGLNVGSHISNVGTYIHTALPTLAQMSYGLEVRDDLVEIHLRHYQPFSKEKTMGFYKVTTFPHTDFDIFLRNDPFSGGMGFFVTKQSIGLKTSLHACYLDFRGSIDWRCDPIMKNSVTLGFTWNFPEKSKKTFNTQSHFIYREIKLAPLSLTLPITTTPVVYEEAPYISEDIIGKSEPIPESIQEIVEKTLEVEEENIESESQDEKDSWWSFFFGSSK